MLPLFYENLLNVLFYIFIYKRVIYMFHKATYLLAYLLRTGLVKRSCNQFGDRCFATAGPTLLNSLPEQLRQPDITFGQ